MNGLSETTANMQTFIHLPLHHSDGNLSVTQCFKLVLVVCKASVKYHLMTALFKPTLNYMVH